MSGPFVPKEEAQVGEPYEKVQLTLQHLAERIERTRERILAYVRAKAQGGIDPLTKRTMQLGIWTELKIILTQCKAFATNRGVVGEFMNDRAKLRKSLLRRKPLTKRFGKYKSFDGAAIAFLSFAEGWLEREGLLLNVSPPPSSFVELEEKSQKWFMNPERREGFLIIIFRARRRKIDILYGPGAPKFQLTFRIQLFNDITERIRELHESLSAFAFLVGDDYSEGEGKKTSRRTSLGEAFG